MGLLASLAAHALLYRGAHAMGAEFQALLLQVAALSLVALIAAFGSAAWRGAKAIADGSVLAARLGGYLPSPLAVFGAAAAWFVLAEAAEPRHAGTALLLTAAALALAAWLMVAVGRGMLSVLARAAIAIVRCAFAPRTQPLRRVVFRVARPKTPQCARRLFARPPPVVWLSRA